VSEEKNKSASDEKTLAKILEAAFVLQKHTREVRGLEPDVESIPDQPGPEQQSVVSPSPQSSNGQDSATGLQNDYTSTLAKIVDTQNLIQVRHLKLEHAMWLVAGRVTDIARAGGAAICFVDGKIVRYRAVAGLKAPLVGIELPSQRALCFPCLETGKVFRCADVKSESLLDAIECQRRGIQSLIAVPVFHDGAVAGGLEVYYAAPHAFTDQDVHTCQLMAGLITEALARNEELTWKQSLATERAAMLEVLEKLKPNLAALVDNSSSGDTTSNPVTHEVSKSAYSCRKCGHKVAGGEQFCGQCGSPRTSDYEPPTMQSKVASLWQMQETRKKDIPQGAENDEPADFIEMQGPEHNGASPESGRSAGDPIEEFDASTLDDLTLDQVDSKGEDNPGAEVVALATVTHPGDASPITPYTVFLKKARLEKPFGAAVKFWKTRRGDIYLAIAVIMIASVLRWEIVSRHSVAPPPAKKTAAAVHKPSREIKLSLFERMLISLGLAEAPEPPADKGNPSVQVWVDAQTALYYCPGADLYGKTPKGKFTTQRDAQLDRYEPAYRKNCP
jgi:hypothetical protein